LLLSIVSCCVALPIGSCLPDLILRSVEFFAYWKEGSSIDAVITTAASSLSSRGGRIAPFAYIGHATPKGKVRFMGYHPIKPHDPLLLSRRVNSIPFLGCPGILEAP